MSVVISSETLVNNDLMPNYLCLVMSIKCLVPLIVSSDFLTDGNSVERCLDSWWIVLFKLNALDLSNWLLIYITIFGTFCTLAVP